jgi:hypothetical protein
MEVGARNDALFKFCLRQARRGGSFDDLLAAAFSFNKIENSVPLDADEVVTTVRSAWRYEDEGRNWVGQEARAVTPSSVLEMLKVPRNGSDALMLLATLQVAHGARHSRGEPFAISPKAMAASRTLGDWGAARIRAASNTLQALGLVKEVHHGGRRRGDHSLFRLSG